MHQWRSSLGRDLAAFNAVYVSHTSSRILLRGQRLHLRDLSIEHSWGCAGSCHHLVSSMLATHLHVSHIPIFFNSIDTVMVLLMADVVRDQAGLAEHIASFLDWKSLVALSLVGQTPAASTDYRSTSS